MVMTVTHSNGLWGAVPVWGAIAQPGTHDVHTVTAGSTTGVFINTTWDGNALSDTGGSNYTIGDIVHALKLAGILAF